ncbi:hypothetical protein ZWY2020_035728 [Hordeum vulgare]|nr:hypothetical protein ZWY2020_035728 [Hordeum vulgare]
MSNLQKAVLETPELSDAISSAELYASMQPRDCPVSPLEPGRCQEAWDSADGDGGEIGFTGGTPPLRAVTPTSHPPQKKPELQPPQPRPDPAADRSVPPPPPSRAPRGLISRISPVPERPIADNSSNC